MLKLKKLALPLVCAACAGGCAAPVKMQARPAPSAPSAAAKPAASAEAMYRAGRDFERQARYDNAIAAYRQALQLDPRIVDAYTGLGTALVAQRRYDEAIRQFQAAVVLAPHVARLHNDLGYAYMQAGATAQAIEALERASQLDPGYAPAQANLRAARARVGEPARGGLRLIEVAPHVYELRAPVERRIEAKPLPAPQAAAPVRPFKVEVANGNGVLGLAKRTAAELASRTIRVTRVTNQRPFDQATTEIQYREGYVAEAAALAEKLQHRPRMTSTPLSRGVDVRLVLGKDGAGSARAISVAQARTPV